MNREPDTPKPQLSDELFRIGVAVIIIVATALRVYDLNLKPPHHDEGVNGFFLTRLVREGVYHYDPNNYHGPTLYYFAWPFVKLLGLNNVAVRLVPVVFGVATIALVFCLRKYIGTAGTLGAACLLAISPGMLFFSRYFIHEMMFVFFTLGIIVAALKYHESRNETFVYLGTACAALLFATKETAFISIAVLGIAWTMAHYYAKLLSPKPAKTKSAKRSKAKEKKIEAPTVIPSPANRQQMLTVICLCAAILVALYVVFYSSFFTNKQGVSDSFKAFQIWTKTGTSGFHEYDHFKYVNWLVLEEAPILVLGLVGAMVAMIRIRNKFAIFVGLWALGITAAYSLIPYKTPWLAINFILPLSISAGYLINEIFEAVGGDVGKYLATGVAGIAIAICMYQAIQVNFYHYDDDHDYVYPYAHTNREYNTMLAEIDRLAKMLGTGTDTHITVMSPDYWPMPWSLNHYKNVGYSGQIAQTNEPIIIGSTAQDEKLTPVLGDKYQRVGTYPLRPGVILVLYLKKDLAK
jgi:uncharacterized protein (TIGR03663 family)